MGLRVIWKNALFRRNFHAVSALNECSFAQVKNGLEWHGNGHKDLPGLGQRIKREVVKRSQGAIS